MLPGVELARRRRVHYHGDAAAKSSSSAEHHHHYSHHAGVPTVAGPALAARIRLEEKLRGAALPPTSPSSRWSRLMRHNHHQSRQQQDDQQVQQQQQAHQQLRPSPPAADPATPSPAVTRRRRAELTRTLSKVDVCAVCLEEVLRDERVTRLPCSHKYHSDCVLPWLAIQPDCPCCRALVPSAAADHTALLIP